MSLLVKLSFAAPLISCTNALLSRPNGLTGHPKISGCCRFPKLCRRIECELPMPLVCDSFAEIRGKRPKLRLKPWMIGMCTGLGAERYRQIRLAMLTQLP